MPFVSLIGSRDLPHQQRLRPNGSPDKVRRRRRVRLASAQAAQFPTIAALLVVVHVADLPTVSREIQARASVRGTRASLISPRPGFDVVGDGDQVGAGLRDFSGLRLGQGLAQGDAPVARPWHGRGMVYGHQVLEGTRIGVIMRSSAAAAACAPGARQTLGRICRAGSRGHEHEQAGAERTVNAETRHTPAGRPPTPRHPGTIQRPTQRVGLEVLRIAPRSAVVVQVDRDRQR
jgi:hypothetical protein